MKKLINKHFLEILFSSSFLYLLIFLDRFSWTEVELTKKVFFSWLIYYLLIFILFFAIIYLFKSLIMYIYNYLKQYYKKNKKLISIIIIIGIMIISIIIRSVLLLKHFTHYDDFGVVSKMFEYSLEMPWERIKFFTFWTYAPFQYLLNLGFVNPNYVYELNLVLGRAPSFIFGILNILLVFKVVTKIIKKEKVLLVILGLILIAFSWENIIYSVQAASYSIGITMILILFDTYIDLIKKAKKMDYLKLTLLSVIACYSQYQLFIFVFSLYASIFIIKLLDQKKQKNKEFLYVIISGLIVVISCIPLLLIIQKYGLLNRGLAWNIGIKGQFILATKSGGGLLKAFDIITYIIKNLVICIRTFFVYKSGNIVTNFIAIIIFVMFIVGLINKSFNKKEYKLTLFFNITLLLYLFMIISGKLILSPSRHNMVLIPIIIVYLIYGLDYLYKKGIKYTNYLVLLLIISITLIFTIDFKYEYKQRQNLIKTSYFKELIEKYNPLSITSKYFGMFSTDYLNIPGYESDMDVEVKTISKVDGTNHNVLIYYDTIESDKLNQNIIDIIIEYHKKYNIPIDYKDITKWKILYQYEYENNTEIEYAYEKFENHPNHFYCYVIEFEV